MRTASGGAGRLGAPQSERGNRIRTHTAPPCGGVPHPHTHASTQLTHATKMIHKIITRFTYSPSPVTRTIIWKFRSHIVTDKQWDVRKTRASSPPLPPPPESAPGAAPRGSLSATAFPSVTISTFAMLSCFAFVFNFSPVDHVFVLSLSRFREQPATGSAEP